MSKEFLHEISKVCHKHRMFFRVEGNDHDGHHLAIAKLGPQYLTKNHVYRESLGGIIFWTDIPAARQPAY